jgi:hypothetical protein
MPTLRQTKVPIKSEMVDVEVLDGPTSLPTVQGFVIVARVTDVASFDTALSLLECRLYMERSIWSGRLDDDDPRMIGERYNFCEYGKLDGLF